MLQIYGWIFIIICSGCKSCPFSTLRLNHGGGEGGREKEREAGTAADGPVMTVLGRRPPRIIYAISLPKIARMAAAPSSCSSSAAGPGSKERTLVRRPEVGGGMAPNGRDTRDRPRGERRRLPIIRLKSSRSRDKRKIFTQPRGTKPLRGEERRWLGKMETQIAALPATERSAYAASAAGGRACSTRQ